MNNTYDFEAAIKILKGFLVLFPNMAEWADNFSYAIIMMKNDERAYRYWVEHLAETCVDHRLTEEEKICECERALEGCGMSTMRIKGFIHKEKI